MVSFHRGEVCHQSLRKTWPFVELNIFRNGLGKKRGGGTDTKFADYAGLCSGPL